MFTVFNLFNCKEVSEKISNDFLKYIENYAKTDFGNWLNSIQLR
jgi:hypothetical protein